MKLKAKLPIFLSVLSTLIIFISFILGFLIESSWRYLIVIPFAIGLSVGAGLLILRMFKEKYDALSKSMEAISSGEFSKKLERSVDSEFGNLSQHINDIGETLKTYVLSVEDKSTLEDKLITLLDVVSTAAEGDFTKKAPVTPDMIGTIADAFNLMSDGLITLITEVKNMAVNVNQQSQTITTNLHEISKEVTTQMLQIEKGAETVASAFVTFQSVAEKALDSSTATDIAFKSSRKGRKSITESAQSMKIVRNTSATTARKMKSLNERFLEIGKIMEIITEVASRTHLLALNASIEASRAGEQGRGFLTIADEIRKLSDKATDSAKDIENIIKSIQLEASEMSLSIERGFQQAEIVAKLANVAEGSFNQVEDAVSVANTAMTDIATATKTQVAQVMNLNKLMTKISQIARMTVEQTQHIEALVEGLNKNSNSLLASTGRFKTHEAEVSELSKAQESFETVHEVFDNDFGENFLHEDTHIITKEMLEAARQGSPSAGNNGPQKNEDIDPDTIFGDLTDEENPKNRK
ncbi:MAG TPA: methyl-accepting chemotaxis protein [Thermodesulfovibrionia bacterium]|nr:methyl-accepting chemotaxis protein [Thermodesulfovibrionia bacterium]